MEKEFDPYYKWLGIPPRDQPPHHYRLLGIEVFEQDRDVIDAAANRVMGYLKDLAVGDEAQYSQKMLNEVSRARLCLLNPQKKAAYDAELRAELAAGSAGAAEPPGNGSALPALAPPAVASPKPAAAASSPPVLVATAAAARPGPPIHVSDNASRGGRHVRRPSGAPSRRLPALIAALVTLAGVGVLMLVMSRAGNRSVVDRPPVQRSSDLPVWPPVESGIDRSEGNRSQGNRSQGNHPSPPGSSEEISPADPAAGQQQLPSSGSNGAQGTEAADDPGQISLPPPRWPDRPGGLPVIHGIENPTSVGESGHDTTPGETSAELYPPDDPATTTHGEPEGSVEPFRDLPAAVSLPPSDSAGTAPQLLGTVHLRPYQPCTITLNGGERAARGTGRFTIREVAGGPRLSWEIMFATEGAAERIARLVIDAAGQLSFAWDPAAAEQPLAGHLGNCILVLTAPRAGSPHKMCLRQPQQLAAVQVDLGKPSSKEEFQLVHPPQAGAIMVEVLGLDGARAKLDVPVLSTIEDGQLVLEVVEGGELLTLDIRTQLKRSLQLQVTPRLRPAPGGKPDLSDLRPVSLKLEDLLKTGRMYIQGATLQQQQLENAASTAARWQLLQQLKQNLQLAQSQLAQLEELQRLLIACDKRLGLRLRVYYDANPGRVDLVYLGEQGI